MIAFAYVNAEGVPTGGGVLREMPDGAVPLPAPFTLADLPRLRWRKGDWEEVRNPVAEPAPAPTDEEVQIWRAEMLTRARAAAIDRINAGVGELRRRIYTDIPGQDALYLEKRTEAVAYVAEARVRGEPEALQDFPLLANEIGLTAPTAWQLAQIWLHLSDQFRAVGAVTEQIRIRAAIGIAQAADEEAIAQIEAEFTQALTGLPI